MTESIKASISFENLPYSFRPINWVLGVYVPDLKIQI